MVRNFGLENRGKIMLLWSRFHTGLTVDELVPASGLSRSRAYAVFTAK